MYVPAHNYILVIWHIPSYRCILDSGRRIHNVPAHTTRQIQRESNTILYLICIYNTCPYIVYTIHIPVHIPIYIHKYIHTYTYTNMVYKHTIAYASLYEQPSALALKWVPTIASLKPNCFSKLSNLAI